MTRLSVIAKNIHSLSRQLDIESQDQLHEYLSEITKLGLVIGKNLISYCNSLLFICSHPFNEQVLTQAEKELDRVTQTLKKSDTKKLRILQNSGLPFTSSVFSFSHECLVWINSQSFGKLELMSTSDYSLNKILEHTLPSLERSNTTADFSNEELFEALLVSKSQRISFLLSQFHSLDQQPTIKDYLFDKLELETKLTPASNAFAIAYNRINAGNTYFQHNWIKQVDVKELINKIIPAPSEIFQKNKKQLINCVKKTMALNIRETDPTTYLDEDSLRFYQLERGISMAIYGMTPGRQLPLESYVGYTLFKNGFPLAYGGSWIFGKRANFGINIFEPYRGGESSYLLAQLLRVYKNVFNVSYFEIEPYQFGLDNPEGIESSAFWFYYRNEFRPDDKKINKLAEREFKHLIDPRSKKVSKSTLKKFTTANLALNLGTTIPISLPSLTSRVTKLIKEEFGGDRQKAVSKCIKLFNSKSKANFSETESWAALEEMALVARTLNITNRSALNIMVSMIETKLNDQYAYQQLLTEFLEKVNSN